MANGLVDRLDVEAEEGADTGGGGRAEVRDVIYMGDILRARMKVAGSEDFVMKFRNTLGQTRLEPGQHIRIGWNPQDARALDPV